MTSHNHAVRRAFIVALSLLFILPPMRPLPASAVIVFDPTIISNGIPEGTLGHWSVMIESGGESRNAFITAQRNASGDIFTENVLFDFFSYVDPGIDGGGFRLSSSNATLPVPDPGNPNIASSAGFFTGQNGNTIDWTVSSSIEAGEQVMTNRYTFTSRDGGPLGSLRFLQYLDEDVEEVEDDVFFAKGTVEGNNLELVTMDSVEAYGVSQSGAFTQGTGQLDHSSFSGWAADVFDNMRPQIIGTGQPVSTTGVINNLLPYTHPSLGEVLGPDDVVTVLAWDVDPSASSATVITSLGGLPDAASALRPFVQPPGDKTALGEIDPNKPTVVITHGLQGENYDAISADGNFDELFSGFSSSEGKQGVGYLVKQRRSDVNIIQFVWPQAFQGSWPEGYQKARPYADDAGVALAKYLTERLGTTYHQPIHFIGHSLGTVVNAHASRLFLGTASNVTRAQMTILDYPARSERLGLGSPSIPSNYFATLLQKIQEEKELKIDNYYSGDFTAVGNTAQGRVYNHPRLNNPNDVEDEVFTAEEANNDHSGVHQWYRWTIEPNGINGTTYCQPNGTFNDPGIFFSNSLNPCNKGWHWSLFGPSGPSSDQEAWNNFPPMGAPISISGGVSLPLGSPKTFGCEYSGGVIICKEQSSPFIIFDIDIPAGAEFLSFDYRFPNVGDGDYVSLLLDDVPLWTFAGSSAFNPDEFTSSGPIPLPQDLTEGLHKLTIALFGVGEKNAEFELKNIETNSAEEHTARSLKELVLEDIRAISASDKDTRKKIDNVAKSIAASLAPELWKDDQHLYFPKGLKVFEKETEAAMIIDLIFRQNELLKKKGKPGLPDEIIHALELAVSDLLSADRMLAEASLTEARGISVDNPTLMEKIQKTLGKAEQAMTDAEQIAMTDPKKAILRNGKAWFFSQAVIKLGEKDFVLPVLPAAFSESE